ncbi:MAG: nucleoside-diphosphate kinase [Candidatus Shapirobacteria bacterium]|nr:nucleoside-diphosphate kinase [Candidatus Shapirobacteria bacterium]
MVDIQKEKTLIIIKPDGVQRTLIGEIIKRYEKTGLKLIAMKMVIPTGELVDKHYNVDPEWPQKVGTKALASYERTGKTPPSTDPLVLASNVLNGLISYLSSGPVVVMVWQGMHAVGIVRKITGSTEPLSSDVGTIRGDFTIDSYEVADIANRSVRNLIHASSSTEESEKEIALWFRSEELMNYRLFNETVLYDTNLDCLLD